MGRILARNLPAEVKVFAFGSRVHGRNLKPFSDIDLCLRGDNPVAGEVLAKLSNELEASMLPFKVDIVDWATISPEFRNRSPTILSNWTAERTKSEILKWMFGSIGTQIVILLAAIIGILRAGGH